MRVVLLFSLLHHLVFYDFSISDRDDSVRLQCYLFVMCDKKNSLLIFLFPWQRNIFLRSKRGYQIIKLINNSQISSAENCKFILSHCLYLISINDNRTACWIINSANHIHKCRFSRTGCSDDCNKFSPFYQKRRNMPAH